MKHVIFDFDGTIADSFDEALAVFKLISKSKTPLTPEVVAELRAQSMREVMRTLGLRPWQIPLVLIRGRRLMTKRMAGIKPFPGIAEALEQLSGSEHRLYVVSTNSATNIQAFLKAHHLDRYFEGITGGIGLSKRRALLRWLKRRRLTPAQCVLVGDETRDVDAARSVGMQVLAVAWGFNAPSVLAKHQPTAIVESPAELANHVK